MLHSSLNMGHPRFWNVVPCMLLLLAVTVRCNHDLAFSTANLDPRTVSRPIRRQLNETTVVPLYGSTGQPEIADIYPCSDNGQIEAPIAALRMINVDVLMSLQTSSDNGRTIVTRLFNPNGGMEELLYASTQIQPTDNPSVWFPKSAWFPAFVDAFNQLDQRFGLPDEKKPAFGSHAARNVNALLWRGGYAKSSASWRADTGEDNFYGKASDENGILLAYTNANRLVPVLPWTDYGYAPLSAIRNMTQPNQPLWPSSVDATGTRYGNRVLLFGDLGWNSTMWELVDFMGNVTEIICSG